MFKSGLLVYREHTSIGYYIPVELSRVLRPDDAARGIDAKVCGAIAKYYYHDMQP